MKSYYRFFVICLCGLAVISLVGCGNKQIELQNAVIKSDVKKINELIKDGADVNFQGKKTSSSLLLEIALRKKVKVLKALIDAGIKIDRSKEWQLGFMASCAHGKDNIEKIELIQKAGGKINDQGRMSNETVLMKAAGSGKLDLVKYLLKHGADASLKDAKGRTAYDFAFKKRILFKGFNEKYMKLLAFFESRGITSTNPLIVEQRKKDLQKIAEDKRLAAEKRKAPRSILVYKFIKYDPVKKKALIELENKTNKTIMTYSGSAQFLRSGKIIYMCGASDTNPNTVAFKPHQKNQWYISNSTMGFFPNANVKLAKEAKSLQYEFVMSKVAFKDGSKQTFK